MTSQLWERPGVPWYGIAAQSTALGKHGGLHVKYPLLLPVFNQNLNVSSNFKKTPQYQISWKFVQPFTICYKCSDGESRLKASSAGLWMPQKVKRAWIKNGKFWYLCQNTVDVTVKSRHRRCNRQRPYLIRTRREMPVSEQHGSIGSSENIAHTMAYVSSVQEQ